MPLILIFILLMVGGRRDGLQPCDPGREDGPRGVPRGHGGGDVQDEVRGGRRQQQCQQGVQEGGSLRQVQRDIFLSLLIQFCFRYDMKDPSQGMDHTVPDGGQYDGTDFEMPEDHPELERCQ